MTITTQAGTQTLTERELLALATRFEIRSAHGIRSFFVDGIEVLEADYLLAFETATRQPCATGNE